MLDLWLVVSVIENMQRIIEDYFKLVHEKCRIVPAFQLPCTQTQENKLFQRYCIFFPIQKKFNIGGLQYVK